MDRFFTILLFLLLFGCDTTNDLNELELRDGVYFAPGSSAPYSGDINSSYSQSDIYGTPYNGIVIVRGKITNGKKEGIWKEWYTRGKPFFEGNFVNGLKEGIHTWWHPNEELLAKGTYLKGLKHGVYTRWYESGDKNLELLYEFGYLHGEQNQWDKEGNRTMYEEFEFGELICRRVFDYLGKLKSKKGRCKSLKI